ncbi:MAG TPA: GNAT family N-acetyltransferase [Agitococcus sp.]|nr:GNAT family N-acetyltransferase [Pseudomonadales bacterium]MCB1673126.1 GNAT family N-acetyltransferase [Pseudomonadales bacterium]MCP5176855.1 GNAT family N-acetyltransferase [Moraxellaceae bacterium]HQV23195.1 GNAT family N-acetyltransferase [Agitococcus sp.]
MSKKFYIKAIQPQDLATIQTIQQAAYPPYFWEDDEAFMAKQQYAPNSCLLLHTAEQQTVAYVFAHPWPIGQIPALNQPLQFIQDTKQVLYIHDLAVAPQWHGQGLASVLIHHLENYANQYEWQQMALVAVQEAQSFWQRLGFMVNDVHDLAHKLTDYGQQAVYMTKTLS